MLSILETILVWLVPWLLRVLIHSLLSLFVKVGSPLWKFGESLTLTSTFPWSFQWKIWKGRRNYWWTGNYKAIHPQVCLTSITMSSIEYIELVIKLLEKTFKIKVSFIEFFAFYHPLFTFLPACQKWEDLIL